MNTPRIFAQFVIVAAMLVAACEPNDPSNNETNNGGANNGANNGVNNGENNGDVDMAPARPSLRIRAVTFNTGRFFDTTCDSGNCDPNAYESVPSPAEFDFRANQITDALASTEADVLLLQEVETQDCMDALAERLPDFEVVEFGEIGGSATVDVGFMARGFTHLETRKHRANTTLELDNGQTRRFARELLEVHLERDGHRAVFFNAHYKAKRDDDPLWRLAEARATHQIAAATQAEFPEALVVIGGDLNDEPGSPPIDALTDGDNGLRLTTELVDDDDAWTYRYFDNTQLIDHLLVFDHGEVGFDPDSVEIVRNSGGTFGGSDHAAVRTDFLIFLD